MKRKTTQEIGLAIKRELVTCFGKVKFSSLSRAKRASKRAGMSRDSEERAVPYFCPFCKHVHLGSPDPGRRKRDVLAKQQQHRNQLDEAVEL